MNTHCRLVVAAFVCLLAFGLVQSEIHRAKTLRTKSAVKSGRRAGSESEAAPPGPDPPRQGAEGRHSRETWIYSLLSASLIGLSGVFPLLVIPLEAGDSLKTGVGASRLKVLLSFAVGGLLGDVFLHLLPEAWKHVREEGHMQIGLWVLAGLFCFLIVEKSFPDKEGGESRHDQTSGWLNLLANVFDNFTHGLAVAGSFCAGTKSGILTTIIILLHEIPHEVGDFAILLRSGFDRWAAARAQLLTATGGMLGALLALLADSASSAGDIVAWVLPFTSGGFIYIALVSVLPELLKEEDSRESLKQILAMVLGICAMAAVAFYLDEHDLPDVITWGAT